MDNADDSADEIQDQKKQAAEIKEDMYPRKWYVLCSLVSLFLRLFC